MASLASMDAVREVFMGKCCLSGQVAPSEVPSLVILVGSDRKEYMVSQACLQKYSRQLYVFGIAAMSRMMNSNVLVSGLSGLGLEISKNVVLAGVRSFSIHDPLAITSLDLASHFYAAVETNGDGDFNNIVGRNRAEISLNKLKELNSLTPVQIYDKVELECTDEGLGRFNVVVIVDGALEELDRIGDYCHREGICFIATGSYGLYGYAFSDFGEHFVVSDATGENPKSGIVSDLQWVGDESGGGDGRSYTFQVQIDSNERHGLGEQDYIILSGFKDLPFEGTMPLQVYPVDETIGEPNRRVRSQTKFMVTLDASVYGNDCNVRLSGKTGYWTEVKQATTIKHGDFSSSLLSPKPEIVITDYMDLHKAQKLHSYFRALHQFQAANSGRLPRPGNSEDAAAVVSVALKLFEAHITSVKIEKDKLLEKAQILLMSLALGAQGRLNPMAAFFGGVVGQEVIKACSGKFMPLQQWLHFESTLSLPRLWSPELGPCLTEDDVRITGHSRYDGQIAVFGRAFQKRINDSSIFLVGSGALGCEFLKNFALIGVGTSSDKAAKVVVTDMDTVEVSNLNRQFLFRDENVGQMKSIAASAVSQTMNTSTQIIPFTAKVAPETEGQFDDDFWGSVDVVVNALDNVDARKFVDSKCVFHQKPLLESGTLGTKSNVQPIVPSVTEGYSDGPEDQQEQDIPLCTLKSFPYLIEHTLAWAKEKFFTEFFHKPTQAALYVENGGDQYLERLDKDPKAKLKYLRYVDDMRGRNAPKIFADCIRWARVLFEELFCNTILQLLSVYPADMVSEKDGTTFWNSDGKKKCPHPIAFDPSNTGHMTFIEAASSLRAKIFGITITGNQNKDTGFLKGVIARTSIEAFVPNKKLKVAATEDEAKELGDAEAEVYEDLDELYAALFTSIKSTADEEYCYAIETFEKDDDSNYHMRFVTATSNLRAAAYGIPQADLMTSKKIVGRIIPAIATTTALTAGAVVFELYKILQLPAMLEDDAGNGANMLSGTDKYLSSNFNLAINMFCQFKPAKADTYTFCGKLYTSWDTIDVNQVGITLKEFCKWFHLTYSTPVSLVATAGSNSVNLYTDFMDDDLVEKRNNTPLAQLAADISGNVLTGKYLLLQVDVDVESDDGSEDEEDTVGSDSRSEEEVRVPDVRILLR
jgi:ubiquitin-activating enzyme E1